MAKSDPIVDCHAHIIDKIRFPFTGRKGYQPRPDESGTREAYVAVLDANGIANGLLVQLSGYGTDNSANLDAAKAYPGRFKVIAVVDPASDDGALAKLAAAGVVGVRFNLPSFDPDALKRPDTARFLRRLKEMGWFAQIYANEAQWPDAAATLRASGVHVLIDHLGVVDIAVGKHSPGFQAVLGLGRDGLASVKLSGLFRVSKKLSGFEDLDPYVDELLKAYGVDGCVWGSDWPFINVPQRPAYGDLLPPLTRWLPDEGDRMRVLSRNPRRLFGFGD